MVSSGTPLPVSPQQLMGYFQGLTRQLVTIARSASPEALTDELAVELLLSRHIRAAQFVLEDTTQTPFFVTRYCTQTLAAQEGLTEGTDGATGFDELMQPMDYDIYQWRRASGRLEVPKRPIVSVDRYRLTLAEEGRIADIPIDWINRDDQHGIIHMLPNAMTSLSSTFFTLFAIHPMLYRPGLGTLTPLLIHLRYSAGMCERTARNGTDPYDPAEYPKNTRWNQQEVQDYQTAIERAAAVPIMRQMLPVLHRGGVSLSVDGLSRSVNPNVLQQDATALEQQVAGWMREKRDRAIGPGWVFA